MQALKSLKHRILESLNTQPGQTDDQLAQALNENRTRVNRTLYLELATLARRDDDLRWYALSELERSEILKTLVAQTSFDHLSGKSLFNVQASTRTLQMSLNADHLFFRSDFRSLDHQGQATVMRLLETLGMALSRRFENPDLIEELIRDWGALLSQRVEMERSSSNLVAP